MLLTAGSRVTNTGLKWNDTHTRTANQGESPSLVEPVSGTVVLLAIQSAKAVTAAAHDGSGQNFSLPVRGGKTYLRRDQDGSVLEKEVSYWIGSGNHARSYLSRTTAGELLELPATWYAEAGGHWGMSPGYSRPDHAGF